MKRILWLLPLFWGIPVALLFGQNTVPLKYEKDIPKNLYVTRYAVLVTNITNKETSPEEEDEKVKEITARLLNDNKLLNLQLVHFAGKNALENPARKTRLLKQYDSLKVNGLLTLDISDFSNQGAEGSYVLLLTGYNRTAKLMSANQPAFTMQANSYEKLIRNLRAEIDQFKPAYFLADPKLPGQKPLAAAPEAPKKTVKKAEQPYKFPLISLTEEDAKRVYGGPHDNFYYYTGTNLQEKNAGFFGQKLRDDLEASPDAVKELNKYRTMKYLYLAERSLFVGALALYANEVLKYDNDAKVKDKYFSTNHQIFLGMAGGSLLINHMLSRSTNKHMFRAISEYNTFATMKNNAGFRINKPDNYSFGYIQATFPSAGLSASWNIR